MIAWITQLDLNILVFIKDNMRSPFLDAIMKFITHLADPKVCPVYPLIFIIIGTIIYVRRGKAGTLDESFRPKFDFAKMGWMLGAALIIGLIVCNLVLKNLIARPRPYTCDGYASLLMIEEQSDKSFPSGHTVALFEMAICVAYSTMRRSRLWGVLAYLYAFVIAYSRLYVGVHYPSDVIAGIVIGTVDGILAILLVNWIYRKFFDKKLYKPTDS